MCPANTSAPGPAWMEVRLQEGELSYWRKRNGGPDAMSLPELGKDAFRASRTLVRRGNCRWHRARCVADWCRPAGRARGLALSGGIDLRWIAVVYLRRSPASQDPSVRAIPHAVRLVAPPLDGLRRLGVQGRDNQTRNPLLVTGDDLGASAMNHLVRTVLVAVVAGCPWPCSLTLAHGPGSNENEPYQPPPFVAPRPNGAGPGKCRHVGRA